MIGHLYRPILRPASFATLPSGVKWCYVEAPTMYGLYAGSDLPRSRHLFGVIATDRALTAQEAAHFDLLPVTWVGAFPPPEN